MDVHKDSDQEIGWPWLLLFFVAAMLMLILGGCTAAQPTDRPTSIRAKKAITACAEEIRSGDLVAARSSLDRAKSTTVGFEQERKVRSLEHLISGAEAMMSGNVQLARVQWSQIDDPYLQRAVRTRAQVIGVEVPMIPIKERVSP